jgi:hypothetical protein
MWVGFRKPDFLLKNGLAEHFEEILVYETVFFCDFLVLFLGQMFFLAFIKIFQMKFFLLRF